MYHKKLIIRSPTCTSNRCYVNFNLIYKRVLSYWWRHFVQEYVQYLCNYASSDLRSRAFIVCFWVCRLYNTSLSSIYLFLEIPIRDGMAKQSELEWVLKEILLRYKASCGFHSYIGNKYLVGCSSLYSLLSIGGGPPSIFNTPSS